MSARVDAVVADLAASGVAPDAVTVDRDAVTVTVGVPAGGWITVELTGAGYWHVSRHSGGGVLWSGTFTECSAAVGLVVATVSRAARAADERAGRR